MNLKLILYLIILGIILSETGFIPSSGIPYESFYTIRQLWTSPIFNATENVVRIQKIGRWGDKKTMLKYCHSNRAEEHEVINSLSEYLENRIKIIKFKKVASVI